MLSYDTSSDAVRYTTAGRLALEFKTSTLDDFGGGTLAAPTRPRIARRRRSAARWSTGKLLTASPGSWTGSPAPTFTYQWQRCDSSGANCANIGARPSSTYSSSRPMSAPRSWSQSPAATAPARPAAIPSTATGCVQPATSPPANSSPPTISGSPVDGQTLTASPGSWTGSPAPTFTYQWQRCDNSGANCYPILGGAPPRRTRSSQPMSAPPSWSQSPAATAPAAAGPISSNATAVVQPATSPPANSSPPTISGTPAEGQTADRLAGHAGRVRRHRRSRISGSAATAAAELLEHRRRRRPTLQLVTADVGSTHRWSQVTGSNSSGSAGPVSSNATAVVQPATTPPSNSSPPTISGSPVDGQILTASPGNWTGSPAPTFSYQWQRCDNSGANCNPILGAASSTYQLTPADVGSTHGGSSERQQQLRLRRPRLLRPRPLSCSRPRPHRRTARRRRSAARRSTVRY